MVHLTAGTGSQWLHIHGRSHVCSSLHALLPCYLTLTSRDSAGSGVARRPPSILYDWQFERSSPVKVERNDHV